MTFGGRVKALRLRRRLGQRELAERAGLRQSHLSQIEAGIRANPQAHIVVALAKSLDCSTDFLLGMYEGSTQERASQPHGTTTRLNGKTRTLSREE